jgi:hypothetical protein
MECVFDITCKYMLKPSVIYTVYHTSLNLLDGSVILRNRIAFRTFTFRFTCSTNYAELLQFSNTFLSLICPSSTRSVHLPDNKHSPCHAFCISSSVFPRSPKWSQSNLPARLPIFIRPVHLSIPFQYFIFHGPSTSIPYPTSSFYSL